MLAFRYPTAGRCAIAGLRSLAVMSFCIGLTGPAAHAAETDDTAESVNMHRAPHAAPVSALPTTEPVGDAATRNSRAYGGAKIDVTTYHYDGFRTGWNQAETDLTPATVASKSFGLLDTLAVDGNVLAQPLLLSGFVMPDGTTHDVLIVATGNNTVYAFDANSYAVLWQVNLGRQQSSNDVGCGDVVPGYGISSTPVIVRSAADAATLYVVAATEPSHLEFHSQLHALSVATGQDTIPLVEIAPSTILSNGKTIAFDPQNQWSRVGLAYNDGALYVGIGSHCDNNAGSITGWLLQYDTTLSLQHAFHTIETNSGTELASIWMTGFAPAIDSAGNVFVVTGNGDFVRGKNDWGESVLKLPPDLSGVTDNLTAAKFGNLNNNDEDFGSGGIMLLPPVAGQAAPPMAVAMGKSSILYLLDQNDLGGLKTHDSGALQAQPAGGSGLWGGPAYYDGPGGPTVFTQTDSDVLHAWSVDTGAKPSLTKGLSGTTKAGYGGSIPIVSSDGAKPKTGVVWLIRRSDPFALEAYDAGKLGAPIFAANIGTWSNEGNGNPFLTPMEANGRVYAPGYLKVQVYGLTP